MKLNETKPICLRGHNTVITGRNAAGMCKVCSRDHQRRFYAKNRANLLPIMRRKAKVYRLVSNKPYLSSQRSYFRRKYNITPEEYNLMFVKQYGKCAICKLHQSELNQRLNVDHDHETGQVRGLLCLNCNLKVVVVLETYPHLIESAQAYLMSRVVKA